MLGAPQLSVVKPSVTALPREFSDHCSIVLSSSHRDYAPTQFMIFDSGMMSGVHNSVEQLCWFRTPDMYLAAKLKHVNVGLKQWRASDHPKDEEELLRLKNLVAHLGFEVESRTWNDDEIDNRNTWYKKIVEMDKKKKNKILYQTKSSSKMGGCWR